MNIRTIKIYGVIIDIEMNAIFIFDSIVWMFSVLVSRGAV
jgi:hypothetical protein